MRNCFCRVAIVTTIFLLTPGGASAQSDTDRGKGSADGETHPYRSVMPMLSMQAVAQPLTKQITKSPVGGYTRIEAEFTPNPAMNVNQARDYNTEERGWWRRLFASKKIGRLLTVKTTLTRPQITTTMALSSLGHESGQSVGENWSTDLTGRRALTPFFRIDPDSVLTLEASLAASSSYDASVATGLLDVLRRAATLVAPTATLATSISDERYSQAAQFIDQTISNLFKQSVSERKLDDFAMKQWAGAQLATVSVIVPIGNDVTPPRGSFDAKQRTITIGTWTIGATKPVLSMFSDRPLEDAPAIRHSVAPAQNEHDTDDNKTGETSCTGNAALCIAFAGITPPAVLGFPVGTDLSVGQALAGESGITSARDRLIAAESESSEAKDAARALCSAIATKAHGLGFNRYDVAAIVWAYANDTFGTDAARAAMADRAKCPPLTVAFAMGLPRDGFTATAAGQQAPAAPDTAAPPPAAPPPAAPPAGDSAAR